MLANTIEVLHEMWNNAEITNKADLLKLITQMKRKADGVKETKVDEAEAAWHNMDLAGLFLQLGEDLTREGLVETPRRVEDAWKEFLEGYTLDPAKILSQTFKADSLDAQMCHNIHFTSMCEHHLLPFIGYVHIAYKPNEVVAGLSKLVRLVDCFARRLQIQERMVEQIANAIEQYLEPKFVIVLAEARHLCCHGRGIRRTEMSFTTTALKGDVPKELIDTLLLKGKSL